VIILGIDPGLEGGLAFIENGERPRCVLACKVPTSGEKAKRRVDARAFIGLLQAHASLGHAFIERAQSMPEQGASSGFVYGRAVGTLEACVQGMLIPLTIVEPSSWKRHHGLIGRGKKDSLQRAHHLFPTAQFRDHNCAEAALIALHGLRDLHLN